MESKDNDLTQGQLPEDISDTLAKKLRRAGIKTMSALADLLSLAHVIPGRKSYNKVIDYEENGKKTRFTVKDVDEIEGLVEDGSQDED